MGYFKFFRGGLRENELREEMLEIINTAVRVLNERGIAIPRETQINIERIMQHYGRTGTANYVVVSEPIANAIETIEDESEDDGEFDNDEEIRALERDMENLLERIRSLD